MTDFNVTVNTRDNTDPADVDWSVRQARAIIPFQVGPDRRPRNPLVPAGELESLPAGRGELWHWGEAVAVDALVFATGPDGVRRLLLIERGDGHGWAVPGGGLDAGESPHDGVARELFEETGLSIDPARFEMQPGRGVPDPRQGQGSWMVTIPGVVDLGHLDVLPDVAGRDDAIGAAWIAATSYPVVHADLAVRGGMLFRAHRDMVRDLTSQS